MNAKKIFSFATMTVCFLMYQNCAINNKATDYRAVKIYSDTQVLVSDNKGQSFLSWNFNSGNEASVEIKYSKFSCGREILLNTEYEKKWSYLLNKIYSSRTTASKIIDQSIQVKANKKVFNVTADDSKNLFFLMQETKEKHKVNIKNCNDEKKWSFKNFKTESIEITKSNSKFLRTFDIIVFPETEKVELKIKEEPVKIAKNSDDRFCDYYAYTYKMSSKLLNLMFNLDEVYNNQKLSGQRSLANAGQDSLRLIEIDSHFKLSIPKDSDLDRNLNEIIHQIKNSDQVHKTCAYSY